MRARATIVLAAALLGGCASASRDTELSSEKEQYLDGADALAEPTLDEEFEDGDFAELSELADLELRLSANEQRLRLLGVELADEEAVEEAEAVTGELREKDEAVEPMPAPPAERDYAGEQADRRPKTRKPKRPKKPKKPKKTKKTATSKTKVDPDLAGSLSGGGTPSREGPGGSGASPSSPPSDRKDKTAPDEAKAAPLGRVDDEDAVCSDVCELEDSTCTLAEQICELAERHDGEVEYEAACTRGRRDCELVEEACRVCTP